MPTPRGSGAARPSSKPATVTLSPRPMVRFKVRPTARWHKDTLNLTPICSFRIAGCSLSLSSPRRSRSQPRSRSHLWQARPAATPPSAAQTAANQRTKAKGSARHRQERRRSESGGIQVTPRARSPRRRTRTIRKRQTTTAQARSTIQSPSSTHRTRSFCRRHRVGRASRGCWARRPFTRRSRQACSRPLATTAGPR